MRSKGVVAAAVLSSALVTGGWLMERGPTGGTHNTASQARLFEEVLQHLRRDYVDTLADSTLYRRAAAGLLNELHDPHTVFLDPKRLGRLDESTSGKYAGVGIQMDVRDSGVTVIATLPASPAERAGIMTGDRIVQIEGKSTTGLTSDEALKTLRGAPESVVKLLVERPGLGDHLTFVLTRKMIEVNAVRHALLLDNGVGYVDLTVFSTAAAEELAHAVDSLRTAGAKSLVFDLRGDPGGLLDQGVGVADLFLDSGAPIVSTRGRTADENRAFADRALVVGTATYGKGSAQRVFRLEGGAVKITTALWYTPSGRSINRPRKQTTDDDPATPGKSDSVPRPRFKTDAGRVVLGGGGIVPDVEVPSRVTTPADKALQVAVGAKIPQFRDAMVEYALSVRTSHAVTSPNFVVTPAMRDALYQRLVAKGVKIERPVYDADSVLIDRALGIQLSRYAFGPREEFARGLREDAALRKALELLNGVTSAKVLVARAGRKG